MEKFIEKFTFYDILGYGLPGFLFLVIAYGILYPDPVLIELKGAITNDAVLILALLTFSHVIGSLFSECGHFFKDMLKGCSWNCLAWMKEMQDNPKQEAVLIEAEKRSENIDESDITPVGELLSDNEIKKMYGDLNADEKYSRIHNYGSVEVMCKNVSVALFFDALIAVIYGVKTSSCPRFVACVPLIICCGMMIHRAMRFEEKKKKYTIIWFMEKYKNK